MNREKELFKNTIVLGIGQLLPKVMSIITLPLMTAYLSLEDYGRYDLVISLASLFIPIMTLQLQQGVFRFLLTEKDESHRSSYISSSVLFLIVVCALLFPIFAVLGRVKSNSLLYCLIYLAFCAEAFYYLLGQTVRGNGDNKRFSFAAIIYSFVNIICLFLSLKVFSWGLYGVIASQMVSYFVSMLYLALFGRVMPFIRWKTVSLKNLNTLLRFSAPIVPSAIALWVVNLSSRVIISSALGVAANGIYAVANKIPNLFSTAYNIFNLSWTETASKTFETEDVHNYYSQMFDALFRFLIGAMLGLIVITPALFKIAIDSKYLEAYGIIPLLYFSVFFNSLVSFYGSLYIAIKNTKNVGISSLAGAVINILLILLLIKKIHLYAAGISAALSFLIIAIYRMIDIGKVIKLKYNIKTIALGMTFFFISVIISYFNCIQSFIFTFVLMLVYNYSQNGYLLKSILNKFKKY